MVARSRRWMTRRPGSQKRDKAATALFHLSNYIYLSLALKQTRETNGSDGGIKPSEERGRTNKNILTQGLSVPLTAKAIGGGERGKRVDGRGGKKKKKKDDEKDQIDTEKFMCNCKEGRGETGGERVSDTRTEGGR